MSTIVNFPTIMGDTPQRLPPCPLLNHVVPERTHHRPHPSERTMHPSPDAASNERPGLPIAPDFVTPRKRQQTADRRHATPRIGRKEPFGAPTASSATSTVHRASPTTRRIPFTTHHQQHAPRTTRYIPFTTHGAPMHHAPMHHAKASRQSSLASREHLLASRPGRGLDGLGR